MCVDRLVQEAVNGSDIAFETLVNKYQPKIYSLCFRMLKSEQDAQDACQNTLVNIYLNIKNFKFKSSFSTWIYTIAKNSALDIIRKRNDEISLYDYVENSSDFIYSLSTESLVVKKNEYEFIINAINTLDNVKRQCIILKDVEGYSLEEISQILNIPKGTVKSRLHRARENLLLMISDSGIDL